MRALALLLSVTVLAGCLGASAPASPAADAPGAPASLDALRALMAGVPCEAEVGEGTSENLRKLGALEFGFPTGEIDIRDDLALVYTESPPGLVVVDLSDPLDMRVIGSVGIFGRPVDVKWTPGGDGAYYGTTRNLTLLDLSDPMQPVVRSTVEMPGYGAPRTDGQAHSLVTRALDGAEYVYASGQTAPHGTFIFQREGWELKLVGEYKTLGLLSGPLGHHDPLIIQDELRDAPTLYVAQGFEGWSAADLGDPARPQRLGGSLPELGGYTHMVRVTFLDGKRIVAVQQEAGVNALYIYDATDLAMPKLLARWNVDPARPHLPQHNLQIVGDHLFLVHYTEGLLVFDLAGIVAKAGPLPQLDVQPVARYAVESADPPSALGFSDYIDLQIDDGVLFLNDIEDGLVSIGFGCAEVGDPEYDALL